MAYVKILALAIALVTSVHSQILAGSSTSVSVSLAADIDSSTATPDTDTPDTDTSTDTEIYSILDDSPTSTTSYNQVATALAASNPTMSSVVSIYFPGADQLPYVASLIGQGNGAQTLAISCGPGVNADTCGFPSSVTVTAGPSTAYVSVANSEATFVYDCKISASTTAICAETFNGNAAYIQSTTGGSGATTSSVTTETLDATDITWMPITITAGMTATGAAASASATATGGGNAAASANAWNNYGGSTSGTSTPSTASTSTGTASTSTGTASTSTGTTSASTGTASTSTSGTVSTASSSSATQSTGTSNNYTWNAWSNMGGASSGSSGATTTGGINISTFTGAAGRSAAIGGFAAGLLALAAMVL